MIISFEGCVCAGKSTVARTLLDDEGILYVPEHTKLLDQQQQQLFVSMSAEEKLAFLLQIDLERLRAVPDSMSTIIIERSVLALFAFEYAMHAFNPHYRNPIICQSICELENHILPKKIIFFSATEAIQRMRCIKRNDLPSEHFLSPIWNHRLREFFEQIGEAIPTFFIDTTKMDTRTMYEVVREKINSTEINTYSVSVSKVLNGLFAK